VKPSLLKDGSSRIIEAMLPEIKSGEQNMSSIRSNKSKRSSMVETLKECRVRVLQKGITVVSVGAGGLNK
jgi:hypothetical protein